MSEQASYRPRRWEGRVPVSLACSECQARNYKTTKIGDKPLELKKYCKQCKKHTLHRETK